MARCAALITAAGSSTRMGGTQKKEYRFLDGKPVLLHSLEAFGQTGLCSFYIITLPPGGEGEAKRVLAPWLEDPIQAEQTRFVTGGDTRQESVFKGLQALEETAPELVLIHDGARPWVDAELITAVYQGTQAHGACLPLLPSVNALKEIDSQGLIQAHLRRERIFAAQTPQGFRFQDILDAHRRADGDGRNYVDDTEIFDAYAGRVFSVPGDPNNKKITYLADLPVGADTPKSGASGTAPAFTASPGTAPVRIGFGYDLHRLVEGRKLLIGGVHIPFPLGEEGHSDGDVLIHAVIDALLGAAGLGDVGSHFPPSDEKYKDISSRVLLGQTAALIRAAGLRLGNLDCTVVLERPRILPHREKIIAVLAEDLGVDPSLISVKGKTKEGVDAVGKGRAVEAYVAALLL